MVYRRTEQEMTRLSARVRVREEGRRRIPLPHAARARGAENGDVTGLECVRMELGTPDASGRRLRSQWQARSS